MLDLLIRGGRVIDPSSGLDGVRDVAISNGRIHSIERDLSGLACRESLDVRDKIVTPGWVDIHAHTYWGVTTWGILPDPLCLASGVTTIVDAGSPGWANFPAFRKWIVEGSHTRVLSFVHISGIGLTYALVGEMEDLRYASVEYTAQTIDEHAAITTGVKVRQGASQVGTNGVKPLRLAIAAAEAAGTRVMVHIGAGVPLPDVLGLLRPGDIVTHCFHGRGDSILDDRGSFLPEVHDARQAGVLFDVGHGSGSFHYPTGRRAIESGFLPDVISSDLHSISVEGPVFDMPTTASKFLNMGMSLRDVIDRVTAAPAKAIGREGEIGALVPGRVADVAVFDLDEGEFEFFDTHGIREVGSQRLTTWATVRAGRIWFPADVRTEHGHPSDTISYTLRAANGMLLREAGIRR
ncbi:amidohydrolase/deacetylase family metallohydrolase [Candidatus Poribacteria bacterium]|nr:amidohydrolase/deacetylase family metallohydrolase [Candidatus Poribacteria bacterium]